MSDLGADWRNHIPGTMGSIDLIFAGHPLDEERAFELLAKLRNEQVGLAEVETAFRLHFTQKSCGQQHADEQVERVQEHYRPWLGD